MEINIYTVKKEYLMNEKKKFKSTLDSKFSKKNVHTKIPGTVEFLTLHLSNPI